MKTKAVTFRSRISWYLPRCCYYLKEKNCDDWGKEHNSVRISVLASEGGRRAKSLRMNGCNYFGASTIRSAPFAIFHRQDILTLALEMDEQWRNGWKEEFHEQLLREGRIRELCDAGFLDCGDLRNHREETRTELCILQEKRSVPDARCADSESTWKKDHTGLICSMRVIRRNGTI